MPYTYLVCALFFCCCSFLQFRNCHFNICTHTLFQLCNANIHFRGEQHKYKYMKLYFYLNLYIFYGSVRVFLHDMYECICRKRKHFGVRLYGTNICEIAFNFVLFHTTSICCFFKKNLLHFSLRLGLRFCSYSSLLLCIVVFALSVVFVTRIAFEKRVVRSIVFTFFLLSLSLTLHAHSILFNVVLYVLISLQNLQTISYCALECVRCK